MRYADREHIIAPDFSGPLDNGVRMVFHEGMTESFMTSCGDAIRKVAEHYA